MTAFLTLAAAPPAEVTGEASVVALIVYVTIALGVSFICSVLEAVLLSTSSSYLELEIKRKSTAAKRMRRHKDQENIDRSISAILTLNTIAHTVGATGAGAEAAAVFGSQWIGVIGAVLTLLILIVSEIIPKTIGAVYWRALNPISALSISVLVWSLYPIVWACQYLTDFLKPKTNEPTVTRAELEILAQLGHKEGSIPAGESRVVRNLMTLDRVSTGDILTPRTVVFALPGETTLEEAARERIRFSRIPIYKESIDDTNEFVLRHDILEKIANGEGQRKLSEIARPLKAVPEITTVAQLLDRFVEEGAHILLVLDEYGGTEGLVTLEDAIESLLGAEIIDESDPIEDMRELAEQQRQSREEERGGGEGGDGDGGPGTPARDSND